MMPKLGKVEVKKISKQAIETVHRSAVQLPKKATAETDTQQNATVKTCVERTDS